jgi:hypothetical protein
MRCAEYRIDLDGECSVSIIGAYGESPSLARMMVLWAVTRTQPTASKGEIATSRIQSDARIPTSAMELTV